MSEPYHTDEAEFIRKTNYHKGDLMADQIKVTGSEKFSLSVSDFKRIGVGVLLAAAGAVASYLATDVIPVFSQDTTDIAKLSLAAFLSVAVNALLKFVRDTTQVVVVK